MKSPNPKFMTQPMNLLDDCVDRGQIVPKSSWSSLAKWGAPIPPLVNPPSGEFAQ